MEAETVSEKKEEIDFSETDLITDYDLLEMFEMLTEWELFDNYELFIDTITD